MKLRILLSFAIFLLVGNAWFGNFGRALGQDSQDVMAAIDQGMETEQQFQTVFDFIRSSAKDEQWREIPWNPSLWSGLELANEQEKPIFLWAMNGDPLGCV